MGADNELPTAEVGQRRSTATRQKLIDAAVDLFAEYGYTATGLAEITTRAKVTTGAFYYHFPSKDALATAVVDQAWPKVQAVVTRTLNGPLPGLEKVIDVTFGLTELMQHDKSVWVANHLNQSAAQISDDHRRDFRGHISRFVNRIDDALADAELAEGISAKQVGSLVLIILHGCELPIDAAGDGIVNRLVLSWSVLLDSIAPAHSVPRLRKFVKQAAQRHGARKVHRPA